MRAAEEHTAWSCDTLCITQSMLYLISVLFITCSLLLKINGDSKLTCERQTCNGDENDLMISGETNIY